MSVDQVEWTHFFIMKIFQAISVLHQSRPWLSFAKRPLSKTSASSALSRIGRSAIGHQRHLTPCYLHPCPSTHVILLLCRNLHIAIGSSHLILIHVSLRIALSCSLKGGYSSRSESQFYPKLVTLLFSFDKIAIKDELESGSSIDGGITRG